MKKKVTKKVAAKTIAINKLLSYFGGKTVTVVLKESRAAGGSPMINGTILDVDNYYYYLGDKLDVELAIPINTVMMIRDGELQDDEDVKPFGDKYQ